MNALKLKGKMAENGLTQTQVADLLGITLGTFSTKLTGKVDFKRSEMERLKEILSLSWDDMQSIFFCG